MRGSPLIRFILLSIALAATALGLLRVTAVRSSGDFPSSSIGQEMPAIAKSPVPFRLLLSAPASAIEIDTGKQIRPSPAPPMISGVLELDPKSPHIGLIIKWKQPARPGEHHFAKLTLEPPGQPTFTYVFDASGDIDDFLELPISETKE